MKKSIILHFALLIFGLTFAQAPNKMSYQAIIRDAGGQLLTNQTIGMRISILRGDNTVYAERQQPTTNINGLVSIVVGSSFGEDGISQIANISWSEGPYFIKTQIDPTGGNNYTITGTTELLSVPFALYSANGTPGPQGLPGINGKTILNGSSDPTDDLGVNGDFYYNTTSTTLYGPKTGDAWSISSGVSLIGPQGLDGKDGQGGVTTAGSGINVTGLGTSTSPYVVSKQNYPCNLSIGDSYAGGIIFYLDATGCHGLVCANNDQSNGIPWYNGVNVSTSAFGSAVGAGDSNTSMIVNTQGEGNYAAKICYDLVLEGYNDWYLPSKYEMYLMIMNIGYGNALGLTNIANLVVPEYWTSTEMNPELAYYQWFTGELYGTGKSALYSVRAVRAF